MNLASTYAGIVEGNQDPLKLARLKVRVPHVFGVSATGSGYIGTNDLPWAMPSGLPNGSNSTSGGLSHIPEVGDKVWVRFLDGEPEKPIWEWGMQSITDAQTFPLQSYAMTGTTVGAPNRAAWFKWNNGIEINQGAVVATTSQGYLLELNDASAPGANDGNVELTTALGNSFKLDDLFSSATLNVLQDVTFLIGGDWLMNADSYTLRTSNDTALVVSGQLSATANEGFSLTTPLSFEVDALTNITLNATATLELDFALLMLGDGAVQPFVLGLQFAAWVESLLLWLTTHIHSNGNDGSPTGPPIIPPEGVVQPTSQQMLSSAIFGQ